MKTLCIRFSNQIAMAQIPLFRGAIIASIPNADTLFHNHQDDNYRYSYPCIQYKRINGCAAIVCIDSGIVAFSTFFANCNFDVHLGSQNMHLNISGIQSENTTPLVNDDIHQTYHLRKWLPLNSDNYNRYKQLEGLQERYTLLEQLLVGNILSLAKGIGVTINGNLQIKLTELSAPTLYTNKGVKMMGFDAQFIANIVLPNYIGLGQKVSLGYGIITKMSNDE